MKSLLLTLMLCFAAPIFSQNKEGTELNIRVDPNKPTVYLSYVCQDEKKIYLRMNNNTVWHVGVGAEKSYFPTKKPITLGNGNKGFAIPNDEEVPVHYYIEKDELENIKKVKTPQKEPYYWLNGGGRIATGDSIGFSVPIEYLRKGLKIYVRFSYEWEIITSFYLAREPMHRVYFRGGDIGSANTGIEPTACQK